jgi:endonuclease/exonuclease/phosphatase family metal-dependent hydrolase
MGNAVLSRFPIHETRTFRLPDQGTGEPRALLYALLDAPWGELPVFVTHLNWRFDHGYVRLLQVAFIAERVSELAPVQSGCLPPVLMGDFNAAPDSDEIRFLTGLHVLDGKSVHFADAWVYGGDGTPGSTYDPRNDYARRNREPPRRIDYVFTRGPDAELRGEPLHARLAFHEPVGGGDDALWASDHFGVYAEIAMDPRSL